MNSKRNSSMKDAFKKLEVQSPYRLPKDGPGFAPPTEVTRTEVPQNEAPLGRVTPSEKPSSENTQGESSQSGVARKEIAETKAPTLEQPHKEVTHGEAPFSEPANIEPPQNEVSDIPRFEPPQTEVPGNFVDEAPSNCFFQLSSAAFSDDVLRNLSGDCFRLFIWMSSRAWRYPNSPGVIRASVSFIEVETGMGHATVSRGLKALKEASLVTLVQTDFKQGNLWKISRLAYAGRSPDPGSGGKPTRIERPQNEAPRKAIQVRSQRASISLKSSETPPQFEEHIKNYKNIRNLSQEDAAPLLARITKMAPPKKQETELNRLEELLGVFAPHVLLKAVEYVETKGTLKGEKCHSPYSYLSLAADEVIKRAFPPTVIPPIIATSEIENVDTAARDQTLAAFETQLAFAEQDAFMTGFIEREFPHGFLPPRSIVKSLAASAWFASVSVRGNENIQLAG